MADPLTFKQREVLADVANHLEEIDRIIDRMVKGEATKQARNYYAMEVLEQSTEAQTLLESIGVPLVREENIIDDPPPTPRDDRTT